MKAWRRGNTTEKIIVTKWKFPRWLFRNSRDFLSLLHWKLFIWCWPHHSAQHGVIDGGKKQDLSVCLVCQEFETGAPRLSWQKHWAECDIVPTTFPISSLPCFSPSHHRADVPLLQFESVLKFRHISSTRFSRRSRIRNVVDSFSSPIHAVQ